MNVSDAKSYLIPVGPLNSVTSLIHFLSRPLHDLSLLYSRGAHITPVFDLSRVEPRHQSMAALTAFLAIAERVSRYIGHPVPIRLIWNPTVLGFWRDIRFLKVARDNAILELSEELIGGYVAGETNPHTMIVRYERDPADPQPDANSFHLRTWKDRNRNLYQDRLSFLCEHIFNPSQARVKIDRRIKDLVTSNAAELTLNAIMHGMATAFVGIQRSSRGITVAVCDCGEGFPKSLSHHPTYGRAVLLSTPTHTQGLLMGSLMNKKEMGLRRAISALTHSDEIEDGWLTMSSYTGEIQWRRPLWENAVAAFSESVDDPSKLDVRAIIGEPTVGTAAPESRERGLHRSWKPGLRGTRVAFELRLRHESIR